MNLIQSVSLHRFLKVGNTPKDNVNKIGSWRQNILKTVAAEGKTDDDSIKLLPTKAKKSSCR
jgi:hypothetical protein